MYIDYNDMSDVSEDMKQLINWIANIYNMSVEEAISAVNAIIMSQNIS